MILPTKLENAKRDAAARIWVGKMGTDATRYDVVVDGHFEHDGAARNELISLRVQESSGDSNRFVRLIVKRWEPTGWVTQLTGIESPVEHLLWKNNDVDDINAIDGVLVPTIGSCRTDENTWIIMEDVSHQLISWKQISNESTDLSPERSVLDRLAALHVKWEDRLHQRRPQSMAARLVSQERRMRWFESLIREWFAGATPDSTESENIRAAKAQLAWAQELESAFLSRLTEKTRSLLLRNTFGRNVIVDAAIGLPKVLIHEDLDILNVGLDLDDDNGTVILIDWELASVANAAQDPIYFLGNPLREVSSKFDIVDYYYDRYRSHGGQAMNNQIWKRSCDIALASYAVTQFPVRAELLIRRLPDEGHGIAFAWVDRIMEALHEIAG